MDPESSQVLLGGALLPVDSISYNTTSHDAVELLSFKTNLWTNSLIFPLYLAGLSVLILLVHLIFRIPPIKRWARGIPADDDAQPLRQRAETLTSSYGFLADAKSHIHQRGGLTVFLFNAVRLILCLCVFGISIYAAVVTEEHDQPSKKNILDIFGWGHHHKKHKHKHKHRNQHWFSVAEWLELAQCGVYAYSSLLALLSLTMRRRSSGIVTRHLNTLLLFAFGVYAYRDLYPLATLHKVPMDGAKGWLTWSRVTLLFLAGVLLPILVPRVHTPVNPQNPLPPNPEQTASILSFFTFSFLDPIIFDAYRIPHLPYEALPVLADYDRAEHLVRRAFPHLDPLVKPDKGGHIFWGLMRVFRQEYLLMIVTLVIKVLAGFAGPLGINHLLLYLETGGRDAVVKPWVWILALFLGPVLGSMGMQWYIWIGTRVLVQSEAILTQLVFEHALRIRMKEDSSPSASGSKAPTQEGTAIHTPASQEGTAREGASGSTETGNTTLKGSSSPSAVDEGSSPVKKVSSSAASPASESKGEEQTKSANLVGKITNLISTDLGNLMSGRDFMWLIIYSPLQIAICIWFLYTILGWSAIVGMATMILSIPIPGRVAQLISSVQVELMHRTDARVQTISEMIGVMRMIKFFGWENKIKKQLDRIREAELKWVQKRQILSLLNMNINYALPLVTMALTFGTYTVIMKQQLTPSKIFSAIAVFDLLQEQLHIVFWEIGLVIPAMVSLHRMNDFFKETELLDRYTESANKDLSMDILPPTADPKAIGFRNCTFSWRTDQPTTSTASTPGSSTPSRRNFQLHLDGTLFFKHEKINLIVGPTGCGKTSLLMALLGEMHFIPEGIDSWFNLPRSGGVAYAAQEAWVLNETIKENIVFGAPYDEERYQKVIKQCALERDLSLFEAGDATEVGEKGMTLSGGQKARVTLARAIYSSADILILDDVLSALDVHTSRWIIDECFKGDLVKGRTVLLVTHNIALTTPIADFVVSLGLNGRVLCQGSVSDALSKDPLLLAEVDQENQAIENEEKVAAVEGKEATTDKPSGKLVAKEEIAEGRISWSAFKLFLGSFGGLQFWIAVFGSMVLSDLGNIMQTWWLGHWGKAYEHLPADQVDVAHYLGGYALIVSAGMIVFSAGFALYVYGAVRASRKIHNQLVDAVMGTTLRWIDSTPTGRIVARFTQDMRSIDGSLAGLFQDVSWMAVSATLKLGAVILFSPVFAIPGFVVGLAGAWVGRIYMASQLSVKREMSNARSPVYSHFNATIAGLTSVRAYGAEQAFMTENQKRINFYSRPSRTFYNLNRWVCVRIDALGGLFAAGLAAYLVYGHPGMDASNTGFSLTMCISFSSMLLWIVRSYNEFEVQGNSLERIEAYVNIEQEPSSTERGKPPAYWPSSGCIRVENLSARYSPDGPEVLRDISFEIQSGERVGVVGRTGAGKSSLSLALLRMIPITGHVYFDNVATDTINLDALRSNITIIPQQPELMSGTLRQNLDPFEEHDDAILNNALRSAGMFNLQVEDDENHIGLDTVISSGGSNFSLGQRQIIALARAMVRRSKVLLLDEATASVDYDTDSAIQKVIATEFDDITLIIVAHRLQTIMGVDKVLVLDAGKVVEFNSPKVLLETSGSTFKAMVDGSRDRETLYGLVKGGKSG